MHDPRDGYKCFRQCGRLFTSIKSLKKHVLSCKENNTAELPKEDLKHPEHAVKHEEKNISENLKNFSLPCQHIENENQVQVRNIDQYDASDSSLKMTLKWLSEDGLSRKIAFDINKDVKLNVIEPLHTLINDLQSSGAMSLECKRSIDSLLANFNCTSEHKFIQHLKTRDLYENPSFFTIHEELQECSEDQLHQQLHRIQGVLMPIKFMLRKYLEMDGVLETILNNLKLSRDGSIRTLVDGSIWQERTSSMCCKTVVPINIYFDDFTTSDTSSCHSKSTSICAIYLNLPSLSGYALGKLSNILTVGYLKTEDRKQHSNDKILSKLVELLIQLEEDGLEIKYQGEKRKVYFVLGFVLGDNLGVNGILDYVESFRANYFCRVCKRIRVQTEVDAKEYPKVFRTIDGYDRDIELNDVSRTGIKSPSIFNKIPSYHVTYNFVFDIMHDIFEGVGVYDLQHILHHFIYVERYFNISDFNESKNYIMKQDYQCGNIIHDISEHQIKTKKIKCTASEMKILITLFPLIVGPFVPKNDKVWKLANSLVQIVHIVLLREVPYVLIKELRKLIHFHHDQYVKLFNDTLKPKHHNMVHYPTAILKGGALRSHWSMRFESKHRESKSYCKINSNRINTCLSLAIKANFKFAYNCVSNSFLPSLLSYEKTQIERRQFHLDHALYVNSELHNVDISSVQFIRSFVKCGLVYKLGTIVCVRNADSVDIVKIIEIFLSKNDDPLMLCERYEAKGFVDHLQSFEVETTASITVISNIETIDTMPISLYIVNEKSYYRVCNYYKFNDI
ncbi:uncharacterized protein LOC115270278 [Aedes albopictus]|uniref:C2H2-type domain-containing protein n=1 Tax=Aedes albopictus TaxID=7160 RepID=A0ABM1Y4F2_AEDAL